MRRLPATLLVVAVLLWGACRSDKVESPEPTVPTSPSSTTIAATDTTAPDPFAVPDQIDAAYVDRVLVELNKVYGDVARKVITTRRFDRSDFDPLGTIFNPPLLEVQIQAFGEIPTTDPALFKDPIGYRLMTVQEVITARSDCIFAKVSLDVSAVLVTPPPAKEKYISLGLKPADADPGHTNPTPWAMAGESSAREDSCAG